MFDNLLITYSFIFVAILLSELFYFKIADKFNIIDKPNERSSHSSVVLRGGGIIFLIGLWIWSIAFNFQYPWLLAGVSLVAGISFIDDIHSLPDSLRLIIQFASMFLVFEEIGLLQWNLWWFVIIALICYVGATNIFNFMDGVNGITGGYSLASLVPMLLLTLNLTHITRAQGFLDVSFLIVEILSVIVFCIFNFRPKGKAKCFAGDVGSISMAIIVLFGIGKLIMKTEDYSWFFIMFMVYGVDGVLTICHRIMLHENLGEAHRKHAYQLMANELKIGHVKVSSLYMILQLIISMFALYLIPDTIFAHWMYAFIVAIVLTVAYVLFMKKYYHLHDEYLSSLKG